MKVLIDTNILLDIMLDRGDFADASEKVIALCCSELVDGFITAKATCDIHYILNHGLHDRKYCKELILSWISTLPIADVLAQDCTEALSSEIIDYEDGIVSAVAKRIGCDYIITRNTQDFRKSEVPAIEPEEFVKLAIKY